MGSFLEKKGRKGGTISAKKKWAKNGRNLSKIKKKTGAFKLFFSLLPWNISITKQKVKKASDPEENLGIWDHHQPLRTRTASDATNGLWGQPLPLRPASASEAGKPIRSPNSLSCQPLTLWPALAFEVSLAHWGQQRHLQSSEYISPEAMLCSASKASQLLKSSMSSAG